MSLDPLVLFRPELTSRYEAQIAAQYFRVEQSRTSCHNALVISRYGLLPFPQELERDLAVLGSQLLHNTPAHEWVSSFAWYEPLRAFTPASWRRADFAHCPLDGPFVVKASRVSRKHHWNRLMFAPTRSAALQIAAQLELDADFAEQGIVFREYIPLRTLEIGPHGLPYANEWRFFFFRQTLLAHGFYWSQGDCLSQARLDARGIDLAQQVAAIAARHVSFFVVDIAERADGGWTLIELNDAQMSGLCEVDPHQLYSVLADTLRREA